MALRASPDRVRGMVPRQVAIMRLVGALVGLAGALGVGKGAQSMLFQMTGADPAVLALSAVGSRWSRSAPASSPRTVRHEWTR